MAWVLQVSDEIKRMQDALRSSGRTDRSAYDSINAKLHKIFTVDEYVHACVIKYKMDHGNIVADLNFKDVGLAAGNDPTQPAPSSATKTDGTHFSPTMHDLPGMAHEETPASHRGLASLDAPRAMHDVLPEHRNVGESPLGQHTVSWQKPRNVEGMFCHVGSITIYFGKLMTWSADKQPRLLFLWACFVSSD
jgi:hypothetical protein